MNRSRLIEIEESFSQLSLTEQLWLLERLVHHLQRQNSADQFSLENQLAAMAADAQIQEEFKKIEGEFAGVEVTA